MTFSKIMQRFVEQRPVAVMTRLLLEAQLSPQFFDKIFEQTADRQYTRDLAFSTAADVLCQVTLGGQSSVNAVFRKQRQSIPVSAVALYEKLQRTEPAVCEALVAGCFQPLAALAKELEALRAEPVAGRRLRIIDGNLLAGTQHRLQVLRDSGAAALPGLSLLLYDHDTGLISGLVACEDGHTNERALMPRLLPLVAANDLIMADRNFCTGEFLGGLTQRGADFLIRHHKGQKLLAVGPYRPAGSCRTGQVFAAQAKLSCGQSVRLIQIRRRQALQEGGKTVILLTSLSAKTCPAAKLATLYLQRWRIEEAFRQLTQELGCEVRTLGYPKAALLAFSLAVLGYNCLAATKALLAYEHGREKVDEELSSYYLAEEIQSTWDGLGVAIPAQEWARLVELPSAAFVESLLQIAAQVDWRRYRKTKRGPKKPTSRTKVRRGSHVATARLLITRK
jgi:hypothetical protein